MPSRSRQMQCFLQRQSTVFMTVIRRRNPAAVKYDEITIQDVIDQKLAAVDLTASILCLENKMPMLVFGLNEENSIVNTMQGKFTGTKVTV